MFGSLGPHRLPWNVRGNLKHPGPQDADGHNKREEEREGGRDLRVYMLPVWVPQLLRSTPSYSHRGNSTRGNALRALQGQQGTSTRGTCL